MRLIKSVIAWVVPCVVLTLCMASCSNEPEATQSNPTIISLAPKSEGIPQIEREFAVTLFSKCQAKSGNVVICPFTAFQTLSILANGDPVQRDRILAYFNMDQGAEGIEGLNLYCQTLIDQLPKVDKNTTLVLNTSLWSDYGFLPDFKNSAETYFKAVDTGLSPYGAEGQQNINKWISDHTNGMISNFLTDPLQMTSAIINVLTFDSSWQEKFDSQLTKPASFHNYSGTVSNVQMMHNVATQRYFDADEGTCYQCARLLYGNGNFSMTILLPTDPAQDIYQFAAELEPSTFNHINQNLGPCHLTLDMPKFDLECKTDLIEPLATSGLDLKNVNFTEITPIFLLTTIPHGIRMKVDEKGTTLASVTMAPGMVISNNPGTATMTLDRPFVFYISEETTGTVLAMGTIAEL